MATVATGHSLPTLDLKQCLSRFGPVNNLGPGKYFTGPFHLKPLLLNLEPAHYCYVFHHILLVFQME